MIENYTELPKFKLDDDLINIIATASWVEFEFTHVANRSWVLERIKSIGNYKNFIQLYGIFQQKVGTAISAKLPQHIEEHILSKITKIFPKEIFGKPVIRAQIVFGGFMSSIIPLHIDETRSSSIVYPITHDESTFTNFYKSSYTVNNQNTRGMIDPSDCKLVDSVVISNVPVLLNVDKIHSVHSNISISKSKPRISVTIKWQDAKYKKLQQYYDTL
jgi:hypothetical protein